MMRFGLLVGQNKYCESVTMFLVLQTKRSIESISQENNQETDL